MIEGSVARRYARALFELARDEGRIDPVAEQLDRFDALARSGDGRLGAVMSNPVYTQAERRAVLDAVIPALGLDPLVARFLRLLLDKDRMAALPDVRRAYRGLADDVAGRVRATVTTAFPLSDELRDQVMQALARATGKQVVLETTVDPSLLGGMVARVGSTLYDASLRTRLDRLQLSLSTPARA